MNPITQTIKEREEILIDDIIHDVEAHNFNSKEARTVIKSHITQSHIALLESVVGVVKSERDKWTIGAGTRALSNVLTELQEALKELKK